MKHYMLQVALLTLAGGLCAQEHPEPEFTNELYHLKKGSPAQVTRLEKSFSKMDTKLKLAGFGGAESAYLVEGEKSTVRFAEGSNLSFIISNGSSVRSNSQYQDSVLRASGIDPSMTNSYESMMDPTSTISLYKADVSKGKRKIVLAKSSAFAKKSQSGKYTFSVKKVREGYWELVVDKPLPEGEYIFTNMGPSSAQMDGSIQVFAFAID